MHAESDNGRTLNRTHTRAQSLCTLARIVISLTTINHLSQRTRRFTEREAADVTRDIATALEHIHSLGIAHRDVKPQNVLCSSQVHASPAKLCDFNLGYAPQDGSQSPLISRDPVGTPDYMSPEVIRQQQGEDISCVHPPHPAQTPIVPCHPDKSVKPDC
jgi:serine/threonine protein kinase